ncbi:MAG: hypothetical protein AAB564_00465 [Patescibacteria group bacterium]
MNMDEIRKMFKENEFRHYTVFSEERKIVFTFDNDHTLSFEVVGYPGINYEWDESIVVKINEEFVART